MHNTLLGRSLIGSVIAAPIIGGLFFGMAKLIEIKDIVLADDTMRVVPLLTPKIEFDPLVVRVRAKKIDLAPKPPPPPRFSANVGDLKLLQIKLETAEPISRATPSMTPMVLDVAIVPDTDARPIRPPTPQFPRAAMEQGISGSCDVRFNVDVRGKPFAIVATCSHDMFKSEAERSVAAVEFAPKIVRGKPAERRNVVYPLDFKVE